jgi:hypothetical protein
MDDADLQQAVQEELQWEPASRWRRPRQRAKPAPLGWPLAQTRFHE